MGYKTNITKKNRTKRSKRGSRRRGGGMFDFFSNMWGTAKSEAMKNLDDKKKQCIESIEKQQEELKKLEDQKAAAEKQAKEAQAAAATASQANVSNPMTAQPVRAPEQQQPPNISGGKRRKSRKSRR